MSRVAEQAAQGDPAAARAELGIVGAAYVGLPLAQTFAEADPHIPALPVDFRNATGKLDGADGDGKVWKL